MSLSRSLIIVGLLFCAGCEKRAEPIAQVANGTSVTEIPDAKVAPRPPGLVRALPGADAGL
jgi:hypothetical protein